MGNLHPEKFVGGPNVLGVGQNGDEWEAFLLWLGVAAFPRERIINPNVYKLHDYVDRVKRDLRYPASFGDCVAANASELRPVSLSNVTTLVEIDEILASSDTHAILAWIARDPRMETWRLGGDPDARLEANFRSYTRRMLQGQPIASYVLWQLRYRQWMPTTDGTRRAPVECVQARIVNDEIRKMFPQPAVQTEHALLRQLKTDRDSLRLAFIRVCVCMNLEDLSWDRCYQVMLELPKVDSAGQAAQSFYRILAEKEEDTDVTELPLREKFQGEGKLWCKLKDNWAYRTLTEGVYFIADATIPKAVADCFPTIDLPKKRGTEKIQRIFCVKALRATDISLEVIQATLIPCSESLDDEVSRLKPFVFALRLDSNPDAAGVIRLKKLKFVACSGLVAKARVSEEEIGISLNINGQSLICGNTAYVVTDDLDLNQPLEDEIVADVVANVLATILQVDRTHEFARLAGAHHERRKGVLALLLQRDANEILDQARKALQISEEEETRVYRGPLPEERPLPPMAEGTKPTEPEKELGLPVPALPDKVGIQQVAYTPEQPRNIRLRVQSNPIPRELVYEVRRVTNGVRCEDVAILFEEERGRYSLRVSAVQEYEGFGCDLVSFETNAEREKFKNPETRDLSLIVRFIEVKGRRSLSGAIEIAGNQLEAAKLWRDRFFIYRVYEAKEGREWQIAVLRDPMAYKWPMSFSANPFERAETEYWSVKPSDVEENNRSTS
ncbi:MAG: DUF3883 domain-containing protein [Planctomycetota bacterium]|nr:DUF3883 domain-containing protein [Planctomycetota bacterium]